MANPTPAKTLIIVASELLQALPPEELPQGAQVLRLVHGVDPINQIKAALQERASNPVEVLRIISPGEPGSILMAGHRITAASLATRSADLAGWATGLAPGADILLYGSSIAARPDGVALVNALASGTGRDVAASRNASGAGGDTPFEVTSGSVSATALASREAWSRSGVRLSLSTPQLAKNISQTAALLNDGSIFTWRSGYGYYGEENAAPTGKGFTQIFSNAYAFAALDNSGRITAWGDPYRGGSGAPTGTGFAQIFSNGSAFAALDNSGKISTWGDGYSGGTGAPIGTGFTQIISNVGNYGGAFAALRSDGRIFAWGGENYGGIGAPTGTGFTQIIANNLDGYDGAFAALSDNGTISTWGSSSAGGSGAPTGMGFIEIVANGGAFAALRSNGSIATWGAAGRGATGAPTGTGFTKIFSNRGGSFAALDANGRITTWGVAYAGGTGAPTGTGFTQIFSNGLGFAALDANGRISSWGDFGSAPPTGSGFVQIFANSGKYHSGSFAALDANGSISSWGDSYGGNQAPPAGTGYTWISSDSGFLDSGDMHMPYPKPFVALKADGTLVQWGGYGYGPGSFSGSNYQAIQSIGDFVPLTFGPSLQISADRPQLGAGQSAQLTFTLSVASTDFTAADLKVTNGTISSFERVAGDDGRLYKAIFTPDANTKADALISVAAGSLSDATDSSKKNQSDVNFSLAVDTTPPQLKTLQLVNNAMALQLQFSQQLAGGQGAPAPSAFTVDADGTAINVNNVAINGDKATLTLAVAVAYTVKQLSVRYSDPTGNNDATALQDLTGQDVATFNGVLTNQAPVLTLTNGSAPLSWQEGTAALKVITSLPALTISDADSTAFGKAVVSFSSGFTAGDQLAVTIAAGLPIKSAYDDTTGQLTLFGQATADQYRDVLSSLSFRHTGQAPTSLSSKRSLTINVSDTGGSGLAPQTSPPVLVSFSVQGVNSAAPELNPSVLNTTASLKVGSRAPSAGGIPAGAVLVRDLVRTGQGGNVTDGDLDPTGVAIVASTNDATAWFSTDGGAKWTEVGAVSKESARLLFADDNTWIYLQPKPGVEGSITEAVTFRAWDRNSAIAGTTWVNGQAGQTTTPSTSGRSLFSLYDAGTNTTRWFEYVANNGITWDSARTLATTRTFGSAQGFLATFASQAEVDAVKGKFSGNAWIGASDAATEGDWKWMTGPEANTSFWSGAANGTRVNNAFVNWNSGEPNNSNNEDYAQLIGSGSSSGKWLDNSAGAAGFLVEYPPITGEPALLPFSTAFDTLSLTVDVNQRPQLARTSASLVPVPAVGSTPVKGANGASTLVRDLLSSQQNQAQASDANSGDLLGIAITAIKPSLELYYSTDAGRSWNKAGALSESNALVLRGDDNTRVQLLDPSQTNATQTISSALSFKAWDGTGGFTSGQSAVNTTGAPTQSDRTGRTLFSYTDSTSQITRWFEYIDGSISWDAARLAAVGRTLAPLQGHLATFTSQAEVDAVKNKFGTKNAWIGASDVASEGDWKWVTGLEAGTSFWSGAANGTRVNSAFANWNTNEPNNVNNEDYAQFNGNSGRWNDNGDNATANGYLVEYSQEFNAGRSPFSSSTASASLELQKLNQAPVAALPGGKALLDGKANYLIASAAVALDNQVAFTDPQLSALNNGAGDYNGARLVLQRDGDANPLDVFSGLNNLKLEPATGSAPGRIVLGNNTATSSTLAIGSWTQANGSLELLFNSNATQAAVNEAASSIGYRFTGTTPPANPIQIRWTFSDGNSGNQSLGGNQGLGGELSTTGTTQVTISAPPVDRTSSAILVSNGSLAVPTTAISAATATTVFELRLTDNDANADGTPNGGSSDGVPTEVKTISLSLQAQSSAALAYQLRGPNLSAPVIGKLSSVVSKQSSDGTNLQFDLSSTPLSIANNSFETYSVEAWYASGSVVDGATLVTLSLNPLQQFSLGTEGSQFNSTSQSLSRQLSGSVAATTFQILAPAQVVSGKANSFTVQAVDANGNLDKDATGSVSLRLAKGSGRFSIQGDSSGEAPTAVFKDGVASFSNLVYRASADAELFSLQALGSGAASGLTTVTSALISADVVATKLEIQGTPSSTTLQSGQDINLKGLSVAAVDADGGIDRQWLASSGVQLSLSGANNQPLAGTANALSLSSADSDSSPITITLDRNAVGSDGRIDLGSLQLSYTNATGSVSDQLALKAERVGGSSLPVALSPLLTSSSTITPNTAPSLTLGGGTPAFTEAGGVNNSSAGSGPVVVAPNAVLSDAEQANLAELKLTITNLQSGDQLALGNPPSGLTAKYDISTGALSISGSVTVAVYQAALRAVTYTNTSDNPDATNRTIAVTVNDGAQINSSTTVNQTITVAPVNDAPTLGGLAAPPATEDTPLALNLSGLAPADADGEATPLTLRLQVSQGSLKASGGAGVSVSSDSNGAELVVVGSASSLTSYLQSSNPVQFIPEAQAHGAVTLSYSLSDGLAAATTGSTTITVAAVNDAAIFRSLPDSSSAAVVRVGQATPLQSLLPGPNPISVVDGDFNDYGAATTLTLTGFNLTLAGLVAGPQGSGTQLPGTTLTIVNASTWQLRGTPAEINTVLENPAIRVQASAAGMKSLKLEIDDGSGLPGATTNATIEVQAISDPLLINSAATPGNAMNGAKDGESSLSFLSITNPDALTSAYSYLAESTYTLSLDASASNGQLIGLSDADPNQPGVQLKGTASQITTALAAGSFKPLADGSTSLALALQSALAPVITGSAFFQVTNPPPTLNQITPLVGAKEDQPFTISFAELSSAADDADKGGSVEGFVVKAISSGSLKIGSSESGASAWALGTNDRITPSLNAYWTPAANANGTGSDALSAFTVVALDNTNAESSTPVPVKVNVAAVNDAPTISGLPSGAAAVSIGVISPLVDFSVADIDSDALTLTLSPLNGTIGSLTDADSTRLGIQLSGSASSINAALVNATFTASTGGAASIGLQLADGGDEVTKATYTFTATKANTAPSLASPGSTRAITTNLADGLSYISVNDADTDQTLTLSLSASGGNFRNLADADPETSGIQLSGSVSAINAALAAGSFVASADGSAPISVSASDRIAAAVNATYTLTASNAAPTLSQVNALSGGKEDQALAISFRDLLGASNGADSNGSVTSFEVTAVDTVKGQLTIGGSGWSNSNKLITTDKPAEWTPAANLNGLPVSAAFQVKAIDNAGLGSAAAVAVAINVAAVNDAPTLGSGSYSFSGITEDTATAAVDVSSLLASRGSDIEGASLGIAIEAATGLGTWQYSTNGGSSWTALGPVATSSALLLANTSQVRYVPDGTGGEAGVSAPSLSFHAWDGSDGSPVGTRVDVTSTGGRGAFSSATNTASLTVSAVEDPLTLQLSRLTTTTNNITAAAITYQELDLDGVSGNDLLLLDPGLTLNDPDSAQTRSAVKLLINSGLVSAEDRLELQGSSTPSSSVVNGETILTSTRSLTVDGPAATVTVKYNQTDGVLDLSTSSTQSEAFWQEVLRLVGYRNDSNNPTTTLNSQPRVVQVEMLADSMFVRRDSNGLPHFYEYVSSDGISWSAAEAAARSRSYGGITGYLATITTQAENDFIAQRLTSNGWIGGSDAGVEGAWRWETGPELGTQFSSAGSVFGTAFSNWGSGEPNNSGSGEDYAQMRADTGKWNDLPNQPSNTDSNRPRGYLIEYSSPSVTDITFSKTFNLSIQAGNDAPVLGLSGNFGILGPFAFNPSLSTVNEDATTASNAGNLVSSFIKVDTGNNATFTDNGSFADANGRNTITDVDTGAPRGGIAIIGLSSGNGTWQYSLNNSGNWLAIGSLSAKQSLLLLPSDAVRFLPDGENATSASFSYRAWDQSSGTAGFLVDTTETGGSTAFSVASNTASISVTAVNDAPSWTSSSPAIDLGTVSAGDSTNTGVLVSALVARGSDPDSGAQPLGAALVGLNNLVNGTNIGTWEVSTNNGGPWTALSGISTSSARLLAPSDRLRFTPTGAVGGTVSLDLRLWDRTTGTAGYSVDLSSGNSSGGSTAYSSASRSITATSSGITLAGTVNSLSLTEGQSLTPGSGITLTAGTLASARVLIASGLSPGDGLAYPAPNGSPITGTYDANKGELVLSGSASHLDYQAALRAVTLTVGDDPTQFQTKRQIAYLLPGQTSSEAYTTVTVTPQADAPSLSAASAVSYAEGGSAVALHPNLSLSDADDLQIASATVTIGSLGKTPDDLLRFSGASGSPITATAYNSGTGVLSLSGTASVAEYQAALRSITFENTSTNPTNFGAATSRTITFAVTDANSDAAGAASGSSPVTLNVSATNSAPALSAGLTRPYTEGGTAVSLDAGSTIEISDGDDTNLSGAVLEIINGYSSGDLLALPTATASSTGISGNWDSNSGKLTLSGTTTLANYQTALRAVTFSSSSDDPTAGTNTSRRIAITVRDANRDGNGSVSGRSTSNSAGVDITITPTANAPVVTLGSPSASFTEAGTPVTLAPALVLSDADDTQLAKAEVRISSGWLPSDQLAYTAVSAISGSYDDSTGLLTFTGPASLAEYQTLLRSITYSSSSGSLPASASRTLSWRVLEANSDGLTPQWSPSVTSTVGVVGINQQPVITSNGSASASYRENDSAIRLNSQLLLSDPDSSQVSSASVTITAGLTAGDTLALAEIVTGITPFFDASTGRLSLNGVASVGAYQHALRSVVFSSSSDNPTAASSTRTLSWQITDLDATPANQATSDPITSTINLTAVNDNPTLGAIPAGSVSGLEDSTITIRYSDLVGNGNSQAQVADVDGTVGRLVVNELLSGSLKLGSSEALATPYIAGSSAVIDGSTHAYWTPAAHANGSGADALRAFTVVAQDNAGALSIEPRTVLVNVAGDQRDGAVITKVTLPPNGTYGVSQTLDFTVEFDRAVTVVTSGGIPSLGISLDSGAGLVAPYLGGNGTSSLLFRYTVLAGNNDPSGLVLASAISLNGGQITSLDDGSSVAANLTLPGLPVPTGLLVDGINDAPVLRSPANLPARYLEGDGPITLNPELALSDSDSPSFSSATIRISAGFSAGDVLALPSQVAASSGVVASWNARSYTLTLTPSSEANAAAPTLLQALRALRAVTYASSSDNPTATSPSRTIAWMLSDSGLSASAVASGSFTITPVNDAPRFSTLSTAVVRTQEDTAAEISVQTLAGVSNASDVDGDVTAYVVKALTSGSLKLGSTVQSATDWVAGSNDVITGTTKAFWTPERDVNGDGISAFTVLARDNGGSNALTSSTAVAVTVDVTPVADLAQITSVQLPAPGTYGPGSVLQFAIRFDRAISLNSAGGVPSLSLQLAGNRSVDAVLQAPQASYAAGDLLSFAYTVVDGDLASSAGIGLPTSVSLPEGSSLTNSDSGVSVAVNRSLPAANSSGLLVDGVRPLLLGIKEAPGSESNRAEQTFSVSFSEPVRNVDATDFRLTATGGASGLVGAVQPVNAINGVADGFDVTVTEINGLGRLVLELDRTGTAIADAVGNPIAEAATASGSMEVDRVGAISRVAGDDRLSLAEASNPELKIKGTVSKALAGQPLNLWLSSASLTSTPLASVNPILARGDGSWSAVVPKASLDPFGTDNYTLTLKQSTTPLGSRDLAIDRNPPSLSDPTSGTSPNPSLSGGVLNKPELADGLTIKGTTDAEDGQLVDVRLGSINASGMVSNGTWDVQFSDTQVQTLSDGSLNLALAVSDLAGNLTTANYGLTLDTTAQVNLAPIANDGWINTAESSQALAIRGAAEGVQDGAAVNLAITFTNGSGASTNFYSATGLLSSGAFSFNLPQGQTWLNGTTYSVTVSGSDAAGNPFSDTKTVTVDTEAPSVDLQLALGSAPAVRFLDAAFAGQFAGASNSSATLNAADWASRVLLSSNASADASTTLVSVNGRSQLVAPITSNGGSSWSLVLSPERFSLPDEGAVTVSAIVTDQAGNSASQSGTLQVDRAATVSINAPVDGVGGNHVLNALEAQAVTLSGTAGSIQVDSSANLLIEVLAEGGSAALINRSVALSTSNWSGPSLDFSGLADGKYMVRTSVSDGAGNRASASQAFAINTASPVFTTTAFAGDSILNASEFSSLFSPSLSGLVSNAEDGQQVNVSLPGAGAVAGRSLAATVDGGVWNLVIPADLLAAYGANNVSYTASLSLTNQAGNTATTTSAFQVDPAAPVLTLSTPSDGQWGSAAANPDANSITLSGTATGLEAGLAITVVINGKALIASRDSANPSQWSLAVPKGVLKGLNANGNSLEVRAQDLAGNPAVLASSFAAPGVTTTPPIIALPANRQVLANEGDGLIRQFQANQPVSWSLAGIDLDLVEINASTGSFSFRTPISLSDDQGDLSLPFLLIATDGRGNQRVENLDLVVRNLADASAITTLDPLDQDGIVETVEDAATNGREGITAGDLNNDGIADKLQPNVAAVPWINKENFQATNADPSKAVANSFTSLQASPAVRISAVAVRKPTELAVGGNGSSAVPGLITTSTLSVGASRQASVTTPYDPLVFQLQSYDATSQQALTSFLDGAPALADGSDPYPGNQVRLVMDLPGNGLLVNTYLKWNPSANRGVGGWFEFLADGDASTFDNGAELVDLNGDGRIDQIRLTYTDGDPLGGDIDGVVNGMIQDPGMPVLLEASSQQATGPGTEVLIVTDDGVKTVKASFYGGSLARGSAITTDTPANLDTQQALQSLGGNRTGFTINRGTIGFDLDLQTGQSQASLVGGLDLVGSDLALTDSDGNRVSHRRLAYYGFNNGAALPLIYNPLNKAGARFYDRSGDGIVDFMTLAMINGGYGDFSGGGANDQLISNSSAAAVVDGAVATLARLEGDAKTLTVADGSVSGAPVNVVLKASLKQRSATSNQIGYVVLDASELANADTVLTLGEMKSRAQTLFSTLEASDVTLPTEAGKVNFEREILLVNGQSVRFFEVSDGTLDEITALSDGRLRFLSLSEASAQQAFLTSSGGVKFQLDLITSDQGLNALIGQEQGSVAVLDFSGFSGTETVQGSLVLAREASFDSVTGFYRTLDREGSVRDALGAILRPGDAGYQAAAQLNLVSGLSNLRIGNMQTNTNSALAIMESSFLAPMATVNGETYFAFAAASSDKLSHFKVLGTNLFGFEDQRGLGDRDFDDLVMGFSFSQIAPV